MKDILFLFLGASRRGQGGKIAHGRSTHLIKGGFPELSHYCASKFAVLGFTFSLAKELQRTGITVNAICPGIIGTQMWYGPNGLAEKWKNPGETMEESWKRHQEVLIPQGVAQTPEDMGDLAVYFATSEHVTAQAVNVDGGFTSH